MGDRRSLQPATSVSTLASSLGRPQAGVSYEDSQTPRKDSLQQRSSADSGLKPGSSPSEGGRELEQAEKAKRDDDEEEEEEEQEEEEEGDSYKEDVLMGDDQVADFANSVLAAISCWHYRARALLSTHFTTVRVSDTHVFFSPFALPFYWLHSLCPPLSLSLTLSLSLSLPRSLSSHSPPSTEPTNSCCHPALCRHNASGPIAVLELHEI